MYSITTEFGSWVENTEVHPKWVFLCSMSKGQAAALLKRTWDLQWIPG